MLKMQIGNLLPGVSVEVDLKYVAELQYENNALRFELPNTHCLPLAKAPVDPQPSAAPAPAPASGFSFSGEFETVAPVVSMRSSVALTQALNGKMATAKFSAPEMSEMFWVELELDRSADPIYTIVEEDEQSNKVAMVSLFPSVQVDQDVLCEIIFLVDRSGSMAGSRISQAKNAMQLFLRSIPVGSLFNIIGFGYRYEKLFPESRPYSEETFNIAKQHALDMQANLQGTDVLPPMRAILEDKPRVEFPRQIFFLTDGEVANTDAVIEYVKDH